MKLRTIKFIVVNISKRVMSPRPQFHARVNTDKDNNNNNIIKYNVLYNTEWYCRTFTCPILTV